MALRLAFQAGLQVDHVTSALLDAPEGGNLYRAFPTQFNRCARGRLLSFFAAPCPRHPACPQHRVTPRRRCPLATVEPVTSPPASPPPPPLPPPHVTRRWALSHAGRVVPLILDTLAETAGAPAAGPLISLTPTQPAPDAPPSTTAVPKLPAATPAQRRRVVAQELLLGLIDAAKHASPSHAGKPSAGALATPPTPSRELGAAGEFVRVAAASMSSLLPLATREAEPRDQALALRVLRGLLELDTRVVLGAAAGRAAGGPAAAAAASLGLPPLVQVHAAGFLHLLAFLGFGCSRRKQAASKRFTSAHTHSCWRWRAELVVTKRSSGHLPLSVQSLASRQPMR